MPPDCKNHTREVEKYDGSLWQLANDVGNLHYDSLNIFLKFLGDKLVIDAKKDYGARRTKIAGELALAAAAIKDAEKFALKAWETSKPFMTKKPE